MPYLVTDLPVKQNSPFLSTRVIILRAYNKRESKKKVIQADFISEMIWYSLHPMLWYIVQYNSLH